MIVCTRGFVSPWIVAADVHMTPVYRGAAAGAELSHVRFKAPNLAGQTTVTGRYCQLTPTRSSQRRGGEGCARGLRPLYLVQPTFTLPAASRSYDRLVPVNVSSRPVAQRPQTLQTGYPLLLVANLQTPVETGNLT